MPQAKTLSLDDWNTAKPITQSEWDTAKPVQTPAPATPLQPSATGGGVLSNALDIGIGMIKSPLQTIEAGGNFLREHIPGMKALDAKVGSIDTGINTAPTNAWQAGGKLAGDIGTAFVPAGLVTKGAKAAATALPLMRGSSVARPLVRGAVEASGGASIAAAQGGDPLTGGLVGGTLGTAAGAVGSVASKLKKSADASMIAALGPAGRGSGPAGTNQVELAKKVAPELLKRNFKPLSHEEALVNIGEAIDAASSEIDTIMTSLPKGTRVRTKPIADALLLAKKQGQVRGVSVGTGKIANDVIDSVLKDLKGIGPSMTPEEAVKFRQRIGPLAKWSNFVGPADNVRAEAHKDVYNGIRTAIENLDPGIRGANKEMSFWLNVRDLIERSSRRPQPPSSGTSGAIIGAVTGQAGGPWGALGAAAVGRQLQRLTRSPGWRFVSANTKDAMADALMARDMGRFNQLVAVAASQGAE